MDRETEIGVIGELLKLKAARTPFLDTSVIRNPVEHYHDERHFEREREAVLRSLPHAAAHVSELAGAGAFLRCDVHGRPVLLTRDRDGVVHAFLNVCRHRGARLVEEAAGCRHRFSCPYHGWTYTNSGKLIGAPHFDTGFGGLDKGDLGLTPLPVHEAFGFIWVVAAPHGAPDFEAYFSPLAQELAALDIAAMTIAAEDHMVRAANWKLIAEGGLEAYHFRTAHRETIGPYFEDNLSSYHGFGPHLRSTLPRTTMAALAQEEQESWRVRDHANLLYTLFPTNQLLVQQDHIVWVRQDPVRAGETCLRIATLALPDAGAAHLDRNHRITMATLEEDFAIGEAIQAGLASGANRELLFGRFEGALDRFNRTVAAYLDPA